jgi:hypothetical protein
VTADLAGGELVQSLTYRETYTPTAPSIYDNAGPGGLTGHAPATLRTAAGAAWALVSITAAGGVLVVLILLLVRVAGWLA